MAVQRPNQKQIYEVPHFLRDLLKESELKICKQVETLAFDQGGCRMIQKKLEEKNQAKREKPGSFVAALIYVMLDILPDVMTD